MYQSLLMNTVYLTQNHVFREEVIIHTHKLPH